MLKNFGDALEFADQTFESVDGKGTSLNERRFEGCTFIKCQLSEASLRGALFIECSFSECDLSNAQTTGARFRDVSFVDCKMVGVNWATSTTIASIKFQKCVLNYSIFESLDMRKCVFEECVVREADFSSANLTEASLRGTDLKGTRFSNTNLSKADFRKAINYSIHPTENKIKKAKFSLPEATLLLHGLEIELEE